MSDMARSPGHRGREWFEVQDRFCYHVTGNLSICGQIISENISHRHTMIFLHGYRGIGPFFRQAEEKGSHSLA